MKIRKLHFFHAVFVGSVVKSADEKAFDMRLGPPGFYVVEERRSGTAYLVPAITCTAEVDLDAEDAEKPAKKGKAA